MMEVQVRVKTNDSREKIKQEDKRHFTVRVKESHAEDEANHTVIDLLANHFNVTRSQVLLTKGRKSANKTFQIVA